MISTPYNPGELTAMTSCELPSFTWYFLTWTSSSSKCEQPTVQPAQPAALQSADPQLSHQSLLHLFPQQWCLRLAEC